MPAKPPEMLPAERAVVDRERKSMRARRGGAPMSLDVIAHVACVGPGSPLREALAVYWFPTRGAGAQELMELANLVVPAWVLSLNEAAPFRRAGVAERAAGGPADPRTSDRAPATVRIVLDYPLQEEFTRAVEIDLRRPGEVFGLAADLYRELYAEDERRGGGAHMDEIVPGSKLMNRASGPLVWGHDIRDLVFEGAHFRRLEASKDPDGCVGEFRFAIGS